MNLVSLIIDTIPFLFSFSKFLDDTHNNKSYWNNFIFLLIYTNAYNKTNQNNLHLRNTTHLHLVPIILNQ